MKGILWEIFELLVTIFECAVSMHFVCRFLGLNLSERHNRKHWFAMILCYATTVSFMNLLMPYEGFLVLLYSLVVFLYTLIFLDGSILKKAFVSLLFLCIIIMNSSLVVNLLSSFTLASVSSIYSTQTLTRLITILFVQSMNMLVFQILEKTICSDGFKMKTREWCLFSAVFILSVICFILIQTVVLQIQSNQTIKLCFLGADLALIFIDIITIRLVSALHQKYKMELENNQMKMQLQYQNQYAETVRQQEKSVHRLRHDLKSTISILNDLIDHNQNAEMKEYIKTYAKSLVETTSIVNTDQPFLNAILNTKLTFAKEQGIICSCHVPRQMPSISGADYCSLLGNLLDNAIEASFKQQAPEIAVAFDCFGTKLNVTVKNRIMSSILEINPNLKSTKRAKSEHGYGINTIRDIANKYNGLVDFYETNGWFIASITLYI